MFALVTRQITSPQAFRQYHRLAERETKPFTRNGIHGAGRVSDQRNISAAHPLQPARSRERASLGRGDVSPVQPSF